MYTLFIQSYLIKYDLKHSPCPLKDKLFSPPSCAAENKSRIVERRLWRSRE